MAGFLRRLLAGWNSFDRVVLVTQEQVGLPLGQAGNDYLDDLRQHGPQRFQTLELTFAEQVELEALQRVVGLAKSRDLEIEPRPGRARTVTEQEVIDSYHRHGRYLASRLLRTLLDATADPATVGEPEALAH